MATKRITKRIKNQGGVKTVKKFIILPFIITVLFALSTFAEAKSVYLLRGGDRVQDDLVAGVLARFGHTVEEGVPFNLFDGSIDISKYNVVLLLDSLNVWYDMPSGGQDSLVSFIRSGHGMITAEWVTFVSHQWGYFATLSPDLPGITGLPGYGSDSFITYRQNEPDSVLDYNLGYPFEFPSTLYYSTESNLIPKERAHTYYDSNALTLRTRGLIGWKHDGGKVLSFNTHIGPDELSDGNYQQLLSNAVNWAGAPVPIPGTAWLVLSGLLGLAILRRKGGILAKKKYLIIITMMVFTIGLAAPAGAWIFVPGYGDTGWQTYTYIAGPSGFTGTAGFVVSNEKYTMANSWLLLDNLSKAGDPSNKSFELGYYLGYTLAPSSNGGVTAASFTAAHGTVYRPTDGSYMSYQASFNTDTSVFHNATGKPGTNGSILETAITLDPYEHFTFNWAFLAYDSAYHQDFSLFYLKDGTGSIISMDGLAQIGPMGPVPVPGTLLLLGSGLLGLAGLSRLGRMSRKK